MRLKIVEAIPAPARFAGVGLINTALGLALIQMGLLLGWNDYAANAAGYAGGFVCSYLLNRSFTFAASEGRHARQLPRFALAAGVAYALNIGVLAIGRSIGIGGTLALQAAAVAIYTVAFYLLSRRFVFAGGPSATADASRWHALVARTTQSPALIALLVAAAMAPLMLVTTPPLVDAGGHMARWIVQVDAGASPVLRQWYDFKWGLLGNLGCDLLAQGLVPLLGPEAALRAIVAIILGVQALGILTLSRTVHGKVAPTAFFALPFIFGFPLQFGFLNSLLGIGLALNAVALWTALEIRGRHRLQAALFVPMGFGLWLAHTMGLAVFLVGAFAANAARADARGEPAWRVVFVSGLRLLPAVIGPLIAMGMARHGPVEPFAYHQGGGKWLWPFDALRDTWQAWDLAALLIATVAIYLFWRTPFFVRDRGIAVFAVLMAVIYVIMPDTILESQYADMRLVPVTFALFLIAAAPRADSPPALRTVLAIAGLLFVGARWTGNAVAMVHNDRIAGRALSVLSAVPRGTNLVTIVPRTCESAQTPWNIDRRDHISGYALARRQIFDSAQWQMNAGQLLKVHNADAEPYDHDRQTMIYDRSCNGWPGVHDVLTELKPAIRYVWVIGMPAGLQHDGWSIAARAGDSVVLHRIR